jgi:glutaminyl-tRNA synthetase
MYDYAHSLSDSIEAITHSICTLEFEDHRPLYDWCQEVLQVESRSRQIEFARLNLTYTIMSKRKLLQLVQGGHVLGWDDPRMPTICGLRRRGYTPQSIRNFCDRIGIAKRDNMVDVALLEHSLREDLNLRAPRAMAVLRPLRLIIDNYPEDRVEELEAVNNPEDPSAGTRQVPFSKELFIERDDFMEDPPKKFFRLAPGRTVRLRYGYLITCVGTAKNDSGEIAEVHCRYIPESMDENYSGGPKAKATLHWVSARHSTEAEVRLYDRLFSVENPAEEKEGKDFKSYLNPNSLEIVKSCRMEPGLSDAKPGGIYQFERLGYFCVDPDTVPGAPVFNRAVTLRDAWARIVRRGAAQR